ncbi:hypothetical protein [Pelagimonas varians]|uniref:Uncharacterized protein n=1 Tax=Pelagimonas varians TaxID=696760 RepID=A0A238JYE6_9RHOB|nr:hypothetical protein [Pelagimonas varians]PYG33099.1 hypothetical protein C8N36_10294 [Pelagimonas varians]SMX35675.1 hypothetical protein PEV8663_00556 [Pelagimonas varians]
MQTHPSGRPATHTPISIRNHLIVPPCGPAPSRELMQDAWWRAKERQQLEDGTSARIQPQQLDQLSDMINGRPLDKAGSAEIHMIARRRNLLCHKFGFRAAKNGESTN